MLFLSSFFSPFFCTRIYNTVQYIKSTESILFTRSIYCYSFFACGSLIVALFSFLLSLIDRIRIATEYSAQHNTSDLITSPLLSAHRITASLHNFLSRVVCAAPQACREYVELATDDGQRWFRHLKKESTRRADLEQQVETMAKQLRSLEKHAQKAYTLQRSGAGPSATASEKASGAGPMSSRLAVTGAGVGSAVIITQPTSSGTSGAGANGGATGSGVGRNGGSRKRVPPGSGGSSQRAPPGSPSSSSVHSQNDNSISPLAVTPIRTPPDQPAPPLQPLLASSPTFSSSSSNTQAAQAGNLRVLLPGEQQHPAAARLVPNVSMPSFSGLVSTSSTPSVSPSPSPVGSSNARPALEPPESNVADDGMPFVQLLVLYAQ